MKSNLIICQTLANESSIFDLKQLSTNYSLSEMNHIPQVLCCDKISNGVDCFSIEDLKNINKPRNESNPITTIKFDGDGWSLDENSPHSISIQSVSDPESITFDTSKSHLFVYFSYNTDSEIYQLGICYLKPEEDQLQFIKDIAINSITYGPDKVFHYNFVETTLENLPNNETPISNLQLYDSTGELFFGVQGSLKFTSELISIKSVFLK